MWPHIASAVASMLGVGGNASARSTPPRPPLPQAVRTAVSRYSGCVMGSYALHAYMLAANLRPTWRPQDVDVAVPTTDARGYREMRTCVPGATVKRVFIAHHLLVRDSTLMADLDTEETRELRRRAEQENKPELLDALKTFAAFTEEMGDTPFRESEKFHESIWWVVTLDVPEMDVPVQFVGIRANANRLSAELEKITDQPASVRLRLAQLPGESDAFELSPRTATVVHTLRARRKEVCAEREAKYEERGWTYDDDE